MTMIDDEGPEAKKAKLFAAPTIEEICDLRQSEGLYSGRLSQLKVDEIIKEISPTSGELQEAKQLARKISELFKGLETLEEFNLSETPESIGNVKIPFNMKPASVKGLVRCIPPKRVKLIRENEAIKYGNKIQFFIEIEMPRDCLQEKDHWDERYYRKRAIYLAYLATAVSDDFVVSFQVTNGVRIKPNLVLSVGNLEFISKIVVEEAFCKPAKLSPSRNNMHVDWWSSITNENEAPPPTPLYNSLILEDTISHESESEKLKELFGASIPRSLNDGLKLFGLWLCQTGLDYFKNLASLFKTYAAYLLSKKRLPRLASGVQMFRLVLESIAAGDLTANVCIVGDLEGEWSIPGLISQSGLNVIEKVPLAAVEWLSHSAKRDLDTLDKDLSEGIVSILIKKRGTLSFVDHVILFPEDSQLQCVLKRNKQNAKIAAVSGDTANLAIEYLGRIVRMSLKDRVITICPLMPKFKTWKPEESPPTCDEAKNVGLGIGLTKADATNNSPLFRGPAADSPAAKNFRALWGNKCEERRFKDGAICVAAHFEGNDPTKQAVDFLMGIHGQVSKVQYFGELDDSFLKSNEEEFKNISEVFSELEQVLRTPDLDVPLKIMQCWPESPSLRGTSLVSAKPIAVHLPKSVNQHNVDVPEVKSLPPHFTSNTVLLQLEGSSKWPQDITAIQKLRKAYHIRLAEILQNKFKMKTAIGENGFSIICRFKEIIFILKTVYHREQQLMAEVIDQKTQMLCVRPNAKSEAEELKTQIRPKFAMLLSKLSIIEQSICRLFRKWIGSHYLSFQIDPLVSDLLVFAALRSDSSGDTGSVRNGFYRVLLFIASFDFVGDVLMIKEFSNQDGSYDASASREYLLEHRKNNFKDYGILISSAADPKRSLITQKGPSFGIVKKLQLLAKASYTKMNSNLSTNNNPEIADLFIGSTKWFDLIINLKTFRFSREKDESQKKNDKHRLEIPDWSITKMLVSRFEEAFGHIALICGNDFEGQKIGVKFKPVKELKGIGAECYGGMGRDTGNELFLNKVGIINDMKIMGEGVIETISVQKEL